MSVKESLKEALTDRERQIVAASLEFAATGDKDVLQTLYGPGDQHLQFMNLREDMARLRRLFG